MQVWAIPNRRSGLSANKVAPYSKMCYPKRNQAMGQAGCADNFYAPVYGQHFQHQEQDFT